MMLIAQKRVKQVFQNNCIYGIILFCIIVGMLPDTDDGMVGSEMVKSKSGIFYMILIHYFINTFAM